MTAEELRGLKLDVIRAIEQASKAHLNDANNRLAMLNLVNSIVHAVKTDFDSLIYDRLPAEEQDDH